MDFTPAPPESECLEWLCRQKIPDDPCFVLDAERLRHNAAILNSIQTETGAKVLLALKAFSAWPVFSMLSRAYSGPLWGTCASSVDEARLGREEFSGEVHAFAAAWNDQEIEILLNIADHILFNSLNQWKRYREKCLTANKTWRKYNPVSFGLRLNPEATLSSPAIYNPCDKKSRLGVRASASITNKTTKDFDGLHFHALCEQGAEDLQTVLVAFEKNFKHILHGRKWLNFGGGHHVTREGYNLKLLKKLITDFSERYNTQIYLEPGEAVALNAGWLTATVLDVVKADLPIAILDVSAACHMPDVLEMPYTPPVWQAVASSPQKAEIFDNASKGDAAVYRLAGKSCLAGDIIGEYIFSEPLKIGDRIIFGDMAIYSMVKTNTFNGLRLPDIGIFETTITGPEFRILKRFSYENFVTRLG